MGLLGLAFAEFRNQPKVGARTGHNILGRLRACDYETFHHDKYARTFGITDDQLNSLMKWKSSDAFDQEQRAALALVDDIILSGAASNESVERVREFFGNDGLVELVVTLSFYEAVCSINLSLAVPLELARGHVVPPHHLSKFILSSSHVLRI